VISRPNPLESGGGRGGSRGGGGGATPWRPARAGLGGKERREEEERGPAVRGILSESWHMPWREARLTRHLSSCQGAPCRRGGSVAPHALARLS
jgi:hypothetical protein